MALDADKIRLRVPLPKEAAEALAAKPLKLKVAQRAQPALLPGHKLPLRVSFWEGTPTHVHAAVGMAILRWTEQLFLHGGFKTDALVVVGSSMPNIDIMVGVKSFEIPFSPEAEFGHVATGMLVGRHTFGKPFGAPNEELGDCELFWDQRYRVKCGRIFVPEDIHDTYTLSSLLAHEFGHGLLLGHDPSTPSRLMYRHHGAVMKPSPKECRWVREIWNE
jgi:hypothetical protein